CSRGLSMKRPSHWILPSTVAAVIAYVWWGLPATPTEQPLRDPAPTVVRRSLTPPAVDPTEVLGGRIIDRLGWPLEGATVRMQEDKGDNSATASDRQGRFTLRARGDAGGRLVHLSAPGFMADACWLLPQEDVERVLCEQLPWTPAASDAHAPRNGELQ